MILEEDGALAHFSKEICTWSNEKFNEIELVQFLEHYLKISLSLFDVFKRNDRNV